MIPTTISIQRLKADYVIWYSEDGVTERDITDTFVGDIIMLDPSDDGSYPDMLKLKVIDQKRLDQDESDTFTIMGMCAM